MYSQCALHPVIYFNENDNFKKALKNLSNRVFFGNRVVPVSSRGPRREIRNKENANVEHNANLMNLSSNIRPKLQTSSRSKYTGETSSSTEKLIPRGEPNVWRIHVQEVNKEVGKIKKNEGEGNRLDFETEESVHM